MAKLHVKLLDDFLIKAAKPKAKPYTLRDGEGLFLLVHTNGSKYFQLRTTLNGKAKLIQLGVYPMLSLSEARVQAAEKLKQVKVDNKDPILEKKKKKQGDILDAQNTFKHVTEDWLSIKGRKLSASSIKKIQQTFTANVYGMLGKYPIKEIDNVMVRNCLLVMQKRGALELMRQTREWIRAVFDFAKNDGLITDNPIIATDIRLETAVIKGYPHLKNMQDAGLLLRNLAKYRGSFEVATCVYLQLHFAQRPTELRAAKWSEFDLDNAVWTLPLERSKTKEHMTKAHTIMLSKQAVAALRELNIYTGHSEYLFASRVNDKELSEATIRKCFRNVFDDYHIVPHGCRHFFSTQANESGLFRADAIETFLSHKDKDQIRKTYNQATYDQERREIAQWWSDQLDMARDGAKVILIKGAA
jgi:integrase